MGTSPVAALAPRLGCLRMRPSPAAAQRVVCQARRRSTEFFKVQRGRGDKLLIFINDYEVAVPQGSLWLLALPILPVLGAGLVLGPIAIALSVAAVAVWFALSASALALFIPLLVLNGLFFGTLASFGFVTSIFPLLMAGCAAAVGWSIVNGIIKSQLPAVEAEPPKPVRAIPGLSVEELEAKEASERMARELREFDDLLADRDQEDTIRWRRRQV